MPQRRADAALLRAQRIADDAVFRRCCLLCRLLLMPLLCTARKAGHAQRRLRLSTRRVDCRYAATLTAAIILFLLLRFADTP